MRPENRPAWKRHPQPFPPWPFGGLRANWHISMISALKVFKDAWGKQSEAWMKLQLSSFLAHLTGQALCCMLYKHLSFSLLTSLQSGNTNACFPEQENEFPRKSFSSGHKARKWNPAFKPRLSDSLVPRPSCLPVGEENVEFNSFVVYF